MEAGAGEITTLEDRLAQRVFYSNKHSQGYHTPSQTGGSTLHARGRCLPPTVLPSHAHGFISPLPAQRPARAPHGLPLRSDTPPPPGLHKPRPPALPAQLPAPAHRRVPSAAVAHWGEGRGGGRASSSRHYTGGRKRSHRSPGSGGSSLALGQRSRAGASEGTAGCPAGWKSEKERRGRGSGCREPPPFSSTTAAPAARPGALAHSPTFSQPRGRSGSPSPPIPHTLAPTPHTLTPSRSSLPHSRTRL